MPTCRRTGRDGEQRGHEHGADARRRPQPAVADAADVEALLGDGRQQGDGAAEQDGEHVEGDGAEQHLATTDEPQPLHGVGQRRTLGRRRARAAAGAGVSVVAITAATPNVAAATTYGTVGSTAYRKPLTAGPTISPNCQVPEYSATRRGSPRSGAISGGRARNDGAAKARAVPNSEGDAEDRHRRRGSGGGVGEVEQRRHDLGRHGDGRHPATVEAVGHRAGQRQQQEGGQELEQPEQSEGQRAVGDVEDLLAERRLLHRRGHRLGGGGEQERADATILEELPSGRGMDGLGRWRHQPATVAGWPAPAHPDSAGRALRRPAGGQPDCVAAP